MKYKIKVTQKHIDKGCPGSSTDCAIALAAKEQLKCYVSVGCGVMNIYSPLEALKVRDLPWKAVKFIHNFDSGNIVHPFEFDLEV